MNAKSFAIGAKDARDGKEHDPQGKQDKREAYSYGYMGQLRHDNPGEQGE